LELEGAKKERGVERKKRKCRERLQAVDLIITVK